VERHFKQDQNAMLAIRSIASAPTMPRTTVAPGWSATYQRQPSESLVMSPCAANLAIAKAQCMRRSMAYGLQMGYVKMANILFSEKTGMWHGKQETFTVPDLPPGNTMVADLAAGMKPVFELFQVSVSMNIMSLRNAPQVSQEDLNQKLLRG
jgi:hypothetical protein